ncbi:MAG: DUF5667 domain-containing protein, partial [Chloroflexota bacterium]
MGQNSRTELDQAIEDVASGRRDLGSIRDADLREAVRLALRLHRSAAAAPDDYTRRRIRARVLARLQPRDAGLLDHAWTALALLGKPAPYLVRAFALAALVAAGGMGATVASADTLPDDLLYPVKLASEEVRLALAGAPEDRAAVELSIAEHRLREAERLATSGKTSYALVASAMYSQHVASAAAELAPLAATSDLALQLETRFATQRERARALASTLATNTKSAAAARILALIAAPTVAPGTTGVQRVADTAAGVAAGLADAAERAVAEQETTAHAAAPVSAPVQAAAAATATATATTTTRERPTSNVTTPHVTAQAGTRATSAPART